MHVHSIPEHVILSVNDFELKRKEKQYDYDEGYERSSSIPRFEEINNGTFCTVSIASMSACLHACLHACMYVCMRACMG